MLARIPALLVALLLAAACSSGGTSNDCKEVCRLEAACVDQIADEDKEDEEQNRFDQSECIAACDALNRDVVGKELVKRHKECAAKHKGNCAALLQCK